MGCKGTGEGHLMTGRFITLLSASIMLTAVICGTTNFSLSGPPMFLSGGEGHELGPDENGTFLSSRGPGAEPRKEPVSNYGTTSKVFEFDDTSGIDVSRSIAVCGGNLTICKRDRRFSVVSDVDPGSEPFATPAHDLAQRGDTLVQGYVVKRSGVYEYMVRSSSDAGGEWTVPFPVIESITGNIVAELEAWGDICILAISYIPDGHGSRPRMEVRDESAPERSQNTGGPEESARILVVDDDSTICDVIRDVLGSRYEIECVTDGRDATERIENDPFDLLVVDYHMPGFDGRQLYEWIEGNLPSMKSRIVFSTGDIYHEKIRAFIDSTGCKCLIKPFSTSNQANRCCCARPPE